MSEFDNPTTEEESADVQPAEMPGFTILQILAWTNAEIAKCREKLEVEPSGRVVAYLQGKIPGCKFAIKTIREIFGFQSESFDDIERPVEMANLSMEQILGAEIDMEQLKENELWEHFISRINTRAGEIKDYLLMKAKKSRELDEYQGEYQGMIHYQKVFGSIVDQVRFWKNSLFKKKSDLEGTETEADANELPALPPPVITDGAEDEYPPDEEYEDDSDRNTEDLPEEGDVISEDDDEESENDPDLDIGDEPVEE